MKTKCLNALALVALIAGIAALSGTPSYAAEETTVGALAGKTHFHGLVVDMNDSSQLFLATHHGLYGVAANGTARRVSKSLDDFMGFVPHPSNASVLFASGHPKGGGNLGVIASEDRGRTWKKLSDGVGGPVDFHQMDVSRSNPKVIYGVHGGLQRSVDGGRSWHKIGVAPDKLIDLAVSSSDENVLYAATKSGLLKSVDGGRSWKPVHTARTPVTMVHVTGKGSIYAYFVGGGLLRADEEVLEWELVNPMINGRYLLHLATDPEADEKLYAVAYDPTARRPSIIVSSDAGASWTELGRQ